ncbi:UbiA family prenyltransferase [Sphingobium indicum]|uniref:UbiA family prenyltransferase n=1 Tax=Sphingobium indicum TaxID=332055 RepID=A0A4V1W970_9SPHN|nr:UbiA family prenyltransferase [Sphingobium indicum]KEY97790.1 prenyltransferase [Sphingomonas sp. BHC-A]NYI24328.1 4-hydroxybenzoate polyprenyltransferase/phosphoserine phosphatase [Sphingobium indicum]RYL98536.1 UbiA family prenyltransferase [Sphingobium indicum]
MQVAVQSKLQVNTQPCPLVVDLDGTLIKGDLLVECLISAFNDRPRTILSSFLRTGWNKAAIKAELAHSPDFDPHYLPYDDQVLSLIRAARAEGRRTYLASAADARLVSQIADHLCLFDDWFASDGTTNLSGRTKRDRLVAEFGEGGFDYIGNAMADVPVWEHAAQGYAVRAPTAAFRHMQRRGRPLKALAEEGGGPRLWLRQLRVHQYVKNALVFVPPLIGNEVTRLALLQSLCAFVAFSLIASSIYIVNDIVDLHADRRHPSKRGRPLASGQLPIGASLIVSGLLLALGLLTGAMVSLPLLGVLFGYFALTSAYSFVLKRKFLIDVLALSLLYAVRVIGGSAATGIVMSDWLLAFAVMFFTSLALIKRYTELAKRKDADLGDASNRNYKVSDMTMVMSMAVASAYVSITVLALYFTSPAVNGSYRHPDLLWIICPIMLYWVGRMLMLAHRRLIHDDPVVFALRDRMSSGMVCLVLLIMFAAH